MSRKKTITISKYLENEQNPLLKTLIKNYYLKDVPIDLLFKVFEERIEKTPSSVANFILDDKNSFELSYFGYRVSGEAIYQAYNGKNKYQGQNSTLGASHSRFHG